MFRLNYCDNMACKIPACHDKNIPNLHILSVCCRLLDVFQKYSIKNKIFVMKYLTKILTMPIIKIVIFFLLLVDVVLDIFCA